MAEKKTTSPKVKRLKRTRRAATVKTDTTHDDIARRAYELWLSEPSSHAFENWLRAERELVPA